MKRHIIATPGPGSTTHEKIRDLPLATNRGQIMTGSLARPDRLAKHDRMIRVEDMPGGQS
jgi:enolase